MSPLFSFSSNCLETFWSEIRGRLGKSIVLDTLTLYKQGKLCEWVGMFNIFANILVIVFNQ